MCVSLDSAFWEPVSSPFWYIYTSICRCAHRGKKRVGQQKCASSLRFTSYICVCVCVCVWFRMSSRRRQGNVCGRLFAGTESNTVFGKSGVKLALEIINTKGTICSLILFIFSMHFRDFLFNKLLVVAHYRQQKPDNRNLTNPFVQQLAA